MPAERNGNMMRSKFIRIVPLLSAMIVLIASCSPPFPLHIMERVDKRVSFVDLHKDPESYKGKWVMLAGVIVDSITEKDGTTYLEVVQKPTDSQGRPLKTDESGGRFIAISKQFLDPAVYQGGREIAVVGEVVGDSVRPLGGMSYRYPVLAIEGLHLWEPSYGPRYEIGVGVGVFHHY